jgi:hypothetical protein
MFDSSKAFIDELEELRAEFFPLATLETVYSRVNRSSLRLVLDAELFIDIYFNTVIFEAAKPFWNKILILQRKMGGLSSCHFEQSEESSGISVCIIDFSLCSK